MIEDKYSIVITKDRIDDDYQKESEKLFQINIDAYTVDNLFNLLTLIKRQYPKKEITFLSNNRNYNEEFHFSTYVDGRALESEAYEKILYSENLDKPITAIKNPIIILSHVRDNISIGNRYPTVKQIHVLIDEIRTLDEKLLDPYLKGLYHQVYRFDLSKCPCGCEIHVVEITTMFVTEISLMPYIRQILSLDSRTEQIKDLIERLDTIIN